MYTGMLAPMPELRRNNDILIIETIKRRYLVTRNSNSDKFKFKSMWTLITTTEQIRSLKVDDLLLQHPLDESEASTNPTGNEENSILYRLHSKKVYSMTDFDITLEFLPKGYIFGDVLISSMKKSIDISHLLNGKWWVKN